MNRKLTLTIEQEVIERAKKFAKEKNRSLSDLIENYLKMITRDKQSEEEKREINPVVKSLRGAFKTSENYDYKKEIRDRIDKKFS